MARTGMGIGMLSNRNGGRLQVWLRAGVTAAAWILAGSTHAAASPLAQAELVLHADQPGARIERDIYGQFSEHLGHGIYGGIWVGPGSKIPNTRGFRNDVVAALKALHVPVLRERRPERA